MVVSLETTERKRAEEELRESEKNLSNFFDSNVDFLWVLDEAGNIITVNNTVKRRLGYKEEELVGESILMVHPPLLREKAGEIVQGMLKGELDSCPIPIMTKDGSKIPVETYINPGKWNGKPALFGVSKDISELKLSEDKFAKAFHTSPSIVGLSDLETGQYIEVNQSFYDILGYEPGEVIGKKSTDLVKMDKEFRDKIIAEFKKNGSIHNKEGIIYAKDGRRVDVLLSAEVIQMQDKKYNFTTALDITERKRAEEKLRESEEKYRMLFQNMLDGFAYHKIVTDENGKAIDYIFMEINDAFEELTGLKREKIIGNKVTEALPGIENDPDDWIGKYGEVALAGKELRFEQYAEPLDRWFSVYAFCPKEGYFATVFEDITERKQAEEELRVLSAVTEQTIEGIALADLEGNLQFVNTAWLAMHGYGKQEELLGKSLTIFHTEDQIQNEVLPFNKIVKQHGYNSGEVGHKRKDGSTFPTLMTCSVLKDEQGKPFALAGITQDITERKRAEEELQKHRDHIEEVVEERTRKLQEKVDELERFHAAAVDREFRIKELRDELEKTQIHTDVNTG